MTTALSHLFAMRSMQSTLVRTEWNRKAGILHTADLQTSNLSLLPEQPPLVELKLLAFQNVSITAAALSRTGADACIQAPSGKLIVQVRI